MKYTEIQVHPGWTDDQAKLQGELLEILAEDLPPASQSMETVEDLFRTGGADLYAELLWNLTNLRYEPAEAERLWQEVIDHKYFMSQRLERNVGIRVAALDYFVNILGKLARPRVVDPDLLDRLYRDATTDPLTGLANRRHFMDRLEAETARAERYGCPFVLTVFDLDDFKQLNDARGHLEGDRALRMVGDVLSHDVRACDIAGRWGGEEFVVLLPEITRPVGKEIADRLRVRIDERLEHFGVTISGGVAAYPEDGRDGRALFSFADRALYRAKAEGKDRISASPLERRRFPRLPENVRVLIHPFAQGADFFEAETSNVSGGGIAFEHDAPLRLSSLIHGEIEMRGRRPRFLGRIVRSEATSEDRYELGVEFLRITPEDRRVVLGSAK